MRKTIDETKQNNEILRQFREMVSSMPSKNIVIRDQLTNANSRKISYASNYTAQDISVEEIRSHADVRAVQRP